MTPASATVLRNLDLTHQIVWHVAFKEKEEFSTSETDVCRRQEVDRTARKDIVALTTVSRAFHIPANKVLWACLSSIIPLLSLLPQFAREYKAHRERNCSYWELKCHLSEPISPEVWTSFRHHASLVRALSGELGRRSCLTEDSWAYLWRLAQDHAPLFPYLNELSWKPSSVSCDDLRLLVSPSLQVLALYCPWEADRSQPLMQALECLLTDRPAALVSLKLYDAVAGLMARIPRRAIERLRFLELEDAHTSAQSLQIASTLPELEYVSVRFRMLPADEAVTFQGFHALRRLHVRDTGVDTPWLLQRCSAPELRELSLEFGDIGWQAQVEFEDLHPLLLLVSDRFPKLNKLTISIMYFEVEAEQTASAFLAGVRPILSLRDLAHLSLWMERREVVVTDNVLERFAEALPALVSFQICFFMLDEDQGEDDEEMNTEELVTRRALAAFARHCPLLEDLHLPWLYVPPAEARTRGPSPSFWVHPAQRACHRLKKLVICRPMGLDAGECALVLDEIFPLLDTDASRKYLDYHMYSVRYGEGREHPVEPWTLVLDALDWYRAYRQQYVLSIQRARLREQQDAFVR
ncbi:hypothetical protein C8Q77DRAFT_288854 [Trametes polyzona]|nr:hypothetical protein C8Q77DRAFT_288854 [Trametes polyzona]